MNVVHVSQMIRNEGGDNWLSSGWDGVANEGIVEAENARYTDRPEARRKGGDAQIPIARGKGGDAQIYGGLGGKQ